MTRTVFAVSLVLALAVTVVTAAEPKATLAGDNPDLAVSTRTQPVLVTNFPATQNVEGTVSIGNLPTDEGGNLRVSASPFSRVLRLVDGEVTFGPGTWDSPVFDTSEFSTLYVSFTLTCNGPGCVVDGSCWLGSQWVEGEDLIWYQNNPLSGMARPIEVFGPQMQIHCGAYNQVLIRDVRVFLRRQ